MSEQAPATETITATEVRAQWSQLLNAVFRGQRRVIVEKSGVPVAAIVSTRDLERWQRMDEERERRFKALEESQAAFQDVPDEEVEREVARAVALTREELRGERHAATTNESEAEPSAHERPLMKYLDLVQDLDLPPDFAAQHHHYLYGTPKR